MKIDQTPNGYILRHAPSETVISSVILVAATLGLILTLSDLSRYFPETLLMLAGCALLYAAGLKAIIRERRCRLTVTSEGIRVHNKRAREDELLRWAEVKPSSSSIRDATVYTTPARSCSSQTSPASLPRMPPPAPTSLSWSSSTVKYWRNPAFFPTAALILPPPKGTVPPQSGTDG